MNGLNLKAGSVLNGLLGYSLSMDTLRSKSASKCQLEQDETQKRPRFSLTLWPIGTADVESLL